MNHNESVNIYFIQTLGNSLICDRSGGDQNDCALDWTFSGENKQFRGDQTAHVGSKSLRRIKMIKKLAVNWKKMRDIFIYCFFGFFRFQTSTWGKKRELCMAS